MIVRIMGEGQVTLADSHLAELNKLDDELLAEMETRRRGRVPRARSPPCSTVVRAARSSRCPTTPWSRPS